jgi:hypothetical protein
MVNSATANGPASVAPASQASTDTTPINPVTGAPNPAWKTSNDAAPVGSAPVGSAPVIDPAMHLGRQVSILNRHASPRSSQPELAWITFIHSNGTVNVGGFDAHGGVFALVGVAMVAAGAVTPSSVFAMWPGDAPANLRVTHPGSPLSAAAYPTGGRALATPEPGRPVNAVTGLPATDAELASA